MLRHDEVDELEDDGNESSDDDQPLASAHCSSVTDYSSTHPASSTQAPLSTEPALPLEVTTSSSPADMVNGWENEHIFT